MLFNVIPLHTKLRFDRQFSICKPERFTRRSEVDPTGFKEDGPRLNNSHPILGCTLTFTHPNFSRLPCYRLVGKYPDPHLAFALHGPGNGDRSEEHTSELQSRENLVCR